MFELQNQSAATQQWYVQGTPNKRKPEIGPDIVKHIKSPQQDYSGRNYAKWWN